MRLISRFATLLTYLGVFTIASILHPSGIDAGIVSVSALFIFRWAWGRRRARSGRLVPPALLLGLLYVGLSSPPTGDAVEMLLLITGTVVVIYMAFLVMLMLADFLFSGISNEKSGIFKRFWWY